MGRWGHLATPVTSRSLVQLYTYGRTLQFAVGEDLGEGDSGVRALTVSASIMETAPATVPADDLAAIWPRALLGRLLWAAIREGDLPDWVDPGQLRRAADQSRRASGSEPVCRLYDALAALLEAGR